MSKNLPFIIAEIGINHNGDIDLAKKLIDASKEAGCHAVKFQKEIRMYAFRNTKRKL